MMHIKTSKEKRFQLQAISITLHQKCMSANNGKQKLKYHRCSTA